MTYKINIHALFISLFELGRNVTHGSVTKLKALHFVQIAIFNRSPIFHELYMHSRLCWLETVLRLGGCYDKRSGNSWSWGFIQFPSHFGLQNVPPPKKRGSLEPIDSKRIDETNLLSRWLLQKPDLRSGIINRFAYIEAIYKAVFLRVSHQIRRKVSEPPRRKD